MHERDGIRLTILRDEGEELRFLDLSVFLLGMRDFVTLLQGNDWIPSFNVTFGSPYKLLQGYLEKVEVAV